MNANPQLASFVGPESWKLWDLLGVRSDWLRLPVHRWAHNNDYIVAKEFVQGLSVVNDAAERCVRSITDYAQATRDSVYREKILLIGNSHREVFQDLRKAALARLQGLSVVNDAAERCVRSITDYAQATRDSVYREKILLIGNSHREVFQDLRKAALARLNP